MIKVTIDYWPKEYCYKCMFCRVSEYGESQCMLMGLKNINCPDYVKPDWCPFNKCEEVDEG